MRSRRQPPRGTLALAFTLSLTSTAFSAEDEPDQSRQLTPDEIEAWLESRAMPGSRRAAEQEGSLAEEAPPPPPRWHGFVIESSVGALGHLGPLKNVSPTAPWFHAKFGFEPLNFAMVFASADVAIASTAFANPPPAPRSYALLGAGGGARLTGKFSDFGLFVQGEAGAAVVTEDVLVVYGYRNTNDLGLYFGGQAGFEWYQKSPHYALALHGGVRDYPTVLARERSSQPPLVVLGGLTLRYTL